MPKEDLSTLDPKKFIIIQGARVHNLKNVSVALPRNKYIVITGLSGSGKSSLAFDTLYAEGQRRYVESLSSYARQFLGRLDKPDVDNIAGISPAVAIEQKVISRNPRSTVGSTTEIYDYLKLLFARVGRTFSPISGKEVKRDTVASAIAALFQFEDGTKALLCCPIPEREDRTLAKQLEILQQQGFTRVVIDEEIVRIEDLDTKKANRTDLLLLIDRFVIRAEDEENTNRISDSLQTAFFEGNGDCTALVYKDKKPTKLLYNNRFEEDGIVFEEPSTHFFSFNSPVGACKTCEGFGSVIGIDADLAIPDHRLSVYDDAVVCWKGEKMSLYKQELIRHAEKFDFPIHRPINELTEEQYNLLWTGNEHFEGLNAFFKYIESKSYKIQYRVMLSRYRGKTKCPDCKGHRLRKDANYVKIDGHSIAEIANLPVNKSLPLFEGLNLNDHDQQIAERLLQEITSRLHFLNEVGLGYLTLMRLSNSLSGGESQRINLANSLGSSLVGSMYILDEPSIGLHPRDTERLIKVLRSLQQLGNTVIVVEHDEEIMLAADQLIDMGPMAGTHGGKVVFQGNHQDLLLSEESMTAKYLTGRENIPLPDHRRKWRDSISLQGVKHHNLKGVDVIVPLRCLVAITGVSGSGKSTLVRQVLYPALRQKLGIFGDKPGKFDAIDGDISSITEIEFIDQNPIGKSSRSNPVTYVKAYDDIRALYAKQQLAIVNHFKPSSFSFNVTGGRCDVCEGEGEVTIEMQFMADIKLRCDSCKGKRFKDEVLAVEYRGKHIDDILRLTVDEAIAFFSEDKGTTTKKLVAKLQPLQDVGLGYVQLGQSSSTLSGGEAQRIKLASFLTKGKQGKHTLFIFDEPTTGLHFHDVRKLLDALQALIALGHSVVLIEHNIDLVKCADWVIDLGPEGGEAGGSILFAGTPEDLAECKASHTGRFLKDKLNEVAAVKG